LIVANYFDTSALCRHYHREPGIGPRDRGMAQTLVSADATMVNVGVREGLVIINPLSMTDI
jgi:hypothetical protein